MQTDSSPCFISSFESDLYNAIQNIRNENPPLNIRNDLYSEAFKHAQEVLQIPHKSVKDGFESRRTLFKNARRYMEINFITKVINSDPISSIIKILKEHYSSRIQSHINSIGPAVVKTKSNKYVIVILCGFFMPIFSIRNFFVYFPKIKEMKQPSSDFESLLELINHFRIMHHYNPLVNNNSPLKSESFKKNLSKTVSYESKKSSDLFCRLFTDQVFIDLIGEIWTDFSYSTEKSDTHSILKMRFIQDEEEYTYKIEVKHPINKNSANQEMPKQNEKINNEIDETTKKDETPTRKDETPIKKDETPIKNDETPIKNEESLLNNDFANLNFMQNNFDLLNEIDDALQILNDDNLESSKENENQNEYKVRTEKENQNVVEMLERQAKKSPWSNYEPLESTAKLSKLDTTKEYRPRQPSINKETVALDRNLLAKKKSSWGKLKPKLKSASISSGDSSDKVNQTNEEEGQNNGTQDEQTLVIFPSDDEYKTSTEISESNKTSTELLEGIKTSTELFESNKTSSELFEGDKTNPELTESDEKPTYDTETTDETTENNAHSLLDKDDNLLYFDPNDFDIEIKQRRNSTSKLLNEKTRSPLPNYMLNSDNTLDEKEEPKNIPTMIKKIPVPTKAWSSMKISGNTPKIGDIIVKDEIVKRASSAWSSIDPNMDLKSSDHKDDFQEKNSPLEFENKEENSVENKETKNKAETDKKPATPIKHVSLLNRIKPNKSWGKLGLKSPNEKQSLQAPNDSTPAETKTSDLPDSNESEQKEATQKTADIDDDKQKEDSIQSDGGQNNEAKIDSQNIEEEQEKPQNDTNKKSLLKGTHKASIKARGQNLMKTSLNAPKKSLPIKSFGLSPPKDKGGK